MKFDTNFLIELFKSGNPPIIPFNHNINELEFGRLKKNYKVEYYDNEPFFYIDDIRYTHDEEKVIEFNLDFYSVDNLVFLVNVPDLEIKEISNRTLLHEFIFLIKNLDIEYEEYKIGSNDYFIIILKSGIVVTFELEEGCLYKIGRMAPDLVV